MRALLLLTLPLAALLAGCFEEPQRIVDCGERGVQDVVLFLAPDGLASEAPSPDAVPIGDFTQAFLTDDLRPFLSAPLADGAWIRGVVTLELWVRSDGAPAPVMVDPNAPGEGYHLFNQFGSDRVLQPAYAVEFADAVAAPGEVWHYTEALEMPPGGFVVEADDRVRVLLTSLATAGPSGRGHHVLVGGDTPSQVRFQAVCYERRDWRQVSSESDDVALPAHQGLLTGAFPPTEGFNRHTFWFDVANETERLTIALRQGPDQNPVKDDMDLVVVAEDGTLVWSAGSPYADETAVLWEENLRAVLPPGRYGARVESYSGMGYEGTLTVTQDRA